MNDMTVHTESSIMDEVISKGNLANLSPDQRALYYSEVCRSIGLNPLTRPFEYINLSGKLTLYARKDCTDQLRQLHQLDLSFVSKETIDGVFIVTARAVKKDGRKDEDIGAVPIKGLQGEALANALMKAHTKAKRRVTLSACGLGFLDESELESIPASEISAPQPDPTPSPDRDLDAELAACETVEQCRLWLASARQHLKLKAKDPAYQALIQAGKERAAQIDAAMNPAPAPDASEPELEPETHELDAEAAQ